MTERHLLNQLIDAMAAAVRAARIDPAATAAQAATATGLRRAVWGALTEQERAEVIAAAVRRAKGKINDRRTILGLYADRPA